LDSGYLHVFIIPLVFKFILQTISQSTVVPQKPFHGEKQKILLFIGSVVTYFVGSCIWVRLRIKLFFLKIDLSSAPLSYSDGDELQLEKACEDPTKAIGQNHT
jgi:hypothetical protein